ncbi:NACHT, LRR and PYD domains-containing protein 3-like isoform X4 [Erythrolamprus reginae]|uniref:NACHT, LRR and PYD domains-containing protein 3-like isoform X4 n=1 Tax=Erythrolamprus reginae TaxID=121349 RepID=UPI00396C6464
MGRIRDQLLFLPGCGKLEPSVPASSAPFCCRKKPRVALPLCSREKQPGCGVACFFPLLCRFGLSGCRLIQWLALLLLPPLPLLGGHAWLHSRPGSKAPCSAVLWRASDEALIAVSGSSESSHPGPSRPPPPLPAAFPGALPAFPTNSSSSVEDQIQFFIAEMNNTVKDAIYKALNELTESEFEEFTWMLRSIDYEGKPNIPKAQLEKASRGNVVDLLNQHYAEDAREVCIQVLRKCNRNDLVKNLEEIGQMVVDAHQLPDLSDYRQYIKEKFETMKDPNAVPGEYVFLNERYSKLMFLDHHLSKQERKKEILDIGRNRPESSTSIETLFNCNKGGSSPKVIVLQGAAGIGKTMMSKKIMFDWASQQLYQDKFNFVFYICCRKMNLHAETEKHSIAEIISEGWLNLHESKKVIPNILKNEGKLLFVIDGFDELYSFDWSKDSFCSDPWKKEPVRILLSSLFQKKLLPKSFLIITTRPTALEKLQCLQNPGYFEILGFSPEEREEYFYKFFGNNDQAIKAFRIVKQNDTLFAMCVIPLVSWIICTVLKEEMERGQDLQKTPYTLTAIYMLYLSSLLDYHQKESKQDVQSNVKGLCSLAAEGILEKKILFMEEEVKKHIRDQGNSLPLFLNQSIFKENIDCIQTYSFIHLSFQEFFAALSYVLEEGDEQHSQNLNENLQTLLKIHKSFETEVVFRFLFGFLSEEKTMRELKKKIGWKICPKIKELMLDWVKDNLKNDRSSMLPIFHYLYETQDDNFVKNALYGVPKLRELFFSSMELMIFNYCIQHCQNLKTLDIECYFQQLPRNEDLEERYMEHFFKALTKLRNLSVLRLSRLILTESCSRYFTEVLRKNQRLRKVLLNFENQDDKAMERLCNVLKHPQCTIQTLGLYGLVLTKSCSRYFTEVLRKNQRLRKVLLNFENQDDKAMELLCDGLKDSQCKIESLGLSGELRILHYHRPHAEVFAEVLSKNQRLRELALSFESYEDESMQLLCDGLNNPGCTVKKLKLEGEILDESCSRYLVDAFKKNQRLTELELCFPSPDDKAVEILCGGLKDPECQIKNLKLDGEVSTISCSWPLAEVFKKNQRLGELTLSFKSYDDKSVELLCDGLNKSGCTVKKLKLDGEILDESCSGYLSEEFKKKQRLRELELCFPSPDEKAVELLYNELKDLEREIKKLKLGGELATISCSCPLAEVPSENQRLREITLSFESCDDQSMQLLCKGLNNPGCTVEKLKLEGEILDESCSGYLAEVFKKNQRLTELELCLPSPDDKAVELLCGGLSDPECKIKKLKLGGEVSTMSCIRPLAEVLKKNQRLGELTLSFESYDGKSMEPLCNGLNNPGCTVEKLKLEGEILTKFCSEYLAEVFKKNQRLRELELCFPSPDDKAVELLCGGLKDPECKIKTLKISGEIPNESYSRHFAEVFMENQNLRQLELIIKYPDEKTVGPLYEGLKHPKCKIETAQLNGVVIQPEAASLLAPCSEEEDSEQQGAEHSDGGEERQEWDEGEQHESPGGGGLSPASSLESLGDDAQAVIDMRQRRSEQRKEQLKTYYKR